MNMIKDIKKNKKLLYLLIIAIFIVFLISANVAAIILQLNQSIGTVNITGLVDQFTKSQAKQNLPPQVLKLRVQTFGMNLDKALHQLSIKKHLVLLPSEAVITGAVDYTKDIEAAINEGTR